MAQKNYFGKIPQFGGRGLLETCRPGKEKPARLPHGSKKAGLGEPVVRFYIVLSHAESGAFKALLKTVAPDSLAVSLIYLVKRPPRPGYLLT